MVPGEFYAAATRPPAVYRGNPFQIEVGLAYGGGPATQRVSREALVEMLGQSDARTCGSSSATTFDGVGPEAADKILHEAGLRAPAPAGKLKDAEIDRLHEAMQNVNLHDGQTMTVLRYANRVPLQFQAGGLRHHADGHVHQLAGLRAEPVARLAAQRPGDDHGPHGQRLGPLHQRIEGGHGRLSRDPEGAAAGLAGRGPQAGDVPPPPQAGQARRASGGASSSATWAKWPRAVSHINQADREALYERLLEVARKKTAEADVELDDRGRPVEEEEAEFGENVLIVERDSPASEPAQPSASNKSITWSGTP